MNIPVMIADTLIEAVLNLAPSARRGASVAAWPRAAGRVTQSDVQASRFMPGFYRARITVQYEVGGERRSYRRVTALGSYERALAQTLRHPIGSHAAVSYNPDRPDEAVLAARVQTSAAAPALSQATS